MTEEEEFEFRLRFEQEQAAQPQAMPKQAAPQPEATAQRTWGQVPLEALTNVPSSAMQYAKGLYQAVRHPVETGKAAIEAAQGGAVNLAPDAYIDFLNKIQPSLAGKRADVAEKGSAVGQFYKDRYGSEEGFKKAIATDPVGILGDVSTVLTGGAGLAQKAPKLAEVLRKGATATNPLNIAGKAIGGTGKLAAEAIGGLGIHTGAESIKAAARAGLEGGESAKTFAKNLRGNVPMTDVLDDAKANLEAMGRAKSAQYRSGMADISKDKSVLGFGDIDKAVTDARAATQFKGQVKNAKAAETLQKINDEVVNWKKLNPAEYHTPEGLDALKQKIGGLVESIPFEEKTARMVGQKVYGSVKDSITKQAPKYAEVMKGYSEATDQIREIERALSLGGKASVDTAMRKLQSLTRNNVNTNYGNRLELAQQLEQQGGRQIMPALAGQALSSWTPRGLGSPVAAATGGAALYNPALAALLPLQSPRLMGEAALKTGQIARLLKQPAKAVEAAGIDPATLANILAQTGRDIQHPQ